MQTALMQVKLTPENTRALKQRIKDKRTFRSVAGEANAIIAEAILSEKAQSKGK